MKNGGNSMSQSDAMWIGNKGTFFIEQMQQLERGKSGGISAAECIPTKDRM